MKLKALIFFCIGWFTLFVPAYLLGSDLSITIQSPRHTLSHMPFQIVLEARDQSGQLNTEFSGIIPVRGLRHCDSDSTLNYLQFHGGKAESPTVLWDDKKGSFEVSMFHEWKTLQIHTLPAWISILPPLIAILSAILFRQVLISLFAGIWLGATCIHTWNPGTGLLRTLDHYFIQAMNSPEHIAVILFTLMLGGMVGIISRSGGTEAIVRLLSKSAINRRQGQIATWLMGLAIFFDDYANTLIVGTTMRPVADRNHISREKLSFIVDATAAPVTSLAVFSTWIGFELGLIQDAFKSLGIDWNVYWTYLETIPFRFYSLWMLALVIFIAITGRDFGPMRKAELRALHADPIKQNSDSDGSNIRRASVLNALLPVIAVIIMTFLGLWQSGMHALKAQGISAWGLREILGAADPFSVLIWSSFGGSLLAGLLALCQKILSIRETMEAFIEGLKDMLAAVIILVGAWCIGQICEDLHTAEFILNLTRGLLHPSLLPAAVFLIAALISFSTGTSWGTLSILIPIIIPVAWRLTLDADFSVVQQHGLLISTIASVLSGSVFGDHCSPISDTTILSSMASGVDHIEHVRTQIPYALLTGSLAMVLGYIPAGFGVSPILLIPVGLLALGFLFYRFSHPVQ
ncbi:Na+/H+ antiporter NhaC family protein [bacterium]